MDSLEKVKHTSSIRHIARFFKIRNTALQFRSPRYGWQKNEKKKNTGNCKAFCVLRKRKKISTVSNKVTTIASVDAFIIASGDVFMHLA